ncbi:MAG: hypothetical protein DRR16_32240, partial [Candidatus Parabeggiatoa sp. nov. 3]
IINGIEIITSLKNIPNLIKEAKQKGHEYVVNMTPDEGKSGGGGSGGSRDESSFVRDDVPPKSGPGSAEHREERWNEYLAKGGAWPKERWDNVYNANMTKATNAHKAVDEYQKDIGWGTREVHLTDIDGKGTTRRLDIADKELLQGVEHKTGYQSATESNLSEVERDQILVEQGWDITWVFEQPPSKPLQNALNEAGIPIEIIGK